MLLRRLLRTESNAFQSGKAPPTLPLPAGRLNPHMTHGSFGPPESTSQTASPSVQLLFCGGHGCDQHTDRQRDRQTHRLGYDCSNRPHLCTRCIRCGLTSGKMRTTIYSAKIRLVKALVWRVQRTAVKAGLSERIKKRVLTPLR